MGRPVLHSHVLHFHDYVSLGILGGMAVTALVVWVFNSARFWLIRKKERDEPPMPDDDSQKFLYWENRLSEALRKIEMWDAGCSGSCGSCRCGKDESEKVD